MTVSECLKRLGLNGQDFAHAILTEFANDQTPKKLGPIGPIGAKSVSEAHRIVLGLFDKLDTTERRIAFGDNERALANLYALRIEIDRAVFNLATGAITPPAQIDVVRCDHPLDIVQRPDGTIYLNIPRRNGSEQYGILINDVHTLFDAASKLLNNAAV